ncbi:MAG: hypothetical protein M1812_005552 [Candelaria pacifica]|nr:MAG: hypothetical protein M1812_005552 [Candelaria pacifica]
MAFGIQHERLERQFPTPEEWTWTSRTGYRSARFNEDPEANGTGLTDWANIGNGYRQLIQRLEDPAKDGSGLSEQEEGGTFVAGVGKTGADLENKSYAWKEGYFEILMGAARAAEHLDGWVKDETRNTAFPLEVVIGPSNPNPKPVPPGAMAPPLEENCSPAFEAPETYYMKILTARGFPTRNRLRAAHAYADWLDFKGLPASAEEMYRWGIDIANSGAHSNLPLVDSSTGVIRADATDISSNLLQATTSLAVHYARNSNVSSALPIFVSILRARRSLPTVSPSALKCKDVEDEAPPSTVSAILSLLGSLITPPSYPPPPPSGDEPPFRTSSELCEEAGVMIYIGEVLFASASYNEGLSWTREAVDLAEERFADTNTDEGGRARCQECLDAGLGNWKRMVVNLANNERKEQEGRKPGWFERDTKHSKDGRWTQEERVVEDRMRRAREILNAQNLAKSNAGKGSMLLFG